MAITTIVPHQSGPKFDSADYFNRHTVYLPIKIIVTKFQQDMKCRGENRRASFSSNANQYRVAFKTGG